MPIDRVGPKVPLGAIPENATARDKRTGKPGGKDEAILSDEALKLLASEKAKKLELIRERVSSHFYESREVTEKVVEGLIRDLKRPPAA